LSISVEKKKGAGFAEPAPLEASYARVGCMFPFIRDCWLTYGSV